VLASGASEDKVDEALNAAAGDARVALVSLLAGVDADAARSRLEASDGSVRKASGRRLDGARAGAEAPASPTPEREPR
jgi:N-acetylmuramic acid 6-phosphate etherase